jgi:DNA-binding NarL/FixJ family response regulator
MRRAVSEISDSVEVVLADPQSVARIGTREVLEDGGVIVVAETESGEEALRMARDERPDVLVCEMDLPELSGLQVAVRLSEAGTPSVAVLALSAYDDERYVRHLMENGIAGYLKKSEAPGRIVDAVRALARGEEGWASPGVVQKAMDLEQRADGTEQLEACGVTEREREVLRLLAKGRSNQQIADALFVSKNTARTHVSRLYEKLGVCARREAIAWAWEHGLAEAQ